MNSLNANSQNNRQAGKRRCRRYIMQSALLHLLQADETFFPLQFIFITLTARQSQGLDRSTVPPFPKLVLSLYK